ncbi:MAG TPA: methyltransferase domain-containing protein [Ignavibacteria bacterium]|nr:methyltransferase domain-containing protein [Ignavibacteria bacterium]
MVKRKNLKAHLLLCMVILISVPILILWNSTWQVIGSVVSASVAIHIGLILLAGGGILAGVRRFHTGRHTDELGAPGTILHSARFYDWLAAAYTLGREQRMRERTLDAASVAVDDHVLDVGCGTGSLVIAAKRRVGQSGSVNGVDASGEMISYAKKKASSCGLSVSFDVAAAQTLPFPDGMFDVVLCSLALHHIPEGDRSDALAEMRRVLKPGGKVLILEFGRVQGFWAVLNPVAMLHTRRSPRILDEVVKMLNDSGFVNVTTGLLGFGGLQYALARLE